MTKAEQREMSELREELLRAKAWRRTEFVGKDIAIPDYKEGLVKGWSYYASGGSFNSDRAVVSCSNSVHHATDQNHDTTSQRAISQYSTKLRALKAMRFDVEEQCVERLVKIDKLIAESEAVSE